MTHFSPQDTPPRSLGFHMPAEWFAHAATWMSYPADDELWFGHLQGVRAEYAELVRTIAQFERVDLLLRDEESEQDARQRLIAGNADGTVGHVVFHRVPLDDVWVRDNGPLFLVKGQELSFVNFRFNGWGGKFDSQKDDQVPEYIAQHLNVAHWDLPKVMEGGALELNGEGVCLTTRSCLLTQTRNAGMTEEDYQQLLRDYLGVSKVLWLDGGLENDHTDGHIDTITRFVDAQTIVTSTEANSADPNHAVMSQNRAALLDMTDAQGRPFRVVDLPLPALRLEGAEGRLPPTYANFYIGNGFVVVPQYHDPNDQQALDILRPLFPQHQVIGLSSRKIIEGGGSFHCMTQQQPVGEPWRG